jgi:hypothetical protein
VLLVRTFLDICRISYIVVDNDSMIGRLLPSFVAIIFIARTIPFFHYIHIISPLFFSLVAPIDPLNEFFPLFTTTDISLALLA